MRYDSKNNYFVQTSQAEAKRVAYIYQWDRLGPLQGWPHVHQIAVLQGHPSQRQRLNLTYFLLGNGVPPWDIISDFWLGVPWDRTMDNAAINQVRHLIDNADNYAKHTYWDMNAHRYLMLGAPGRGSTEPRNPGSEDVYDEPDPSDPYDDPRLWPQRWNRTRGRYDVNPAYDPVYERAFWDARPPRPPPEEADSFELVTPTRNTRRSDQPSEPTADRYS